MDFDEICDLKWSLKQFDFADKLWDKLINYETIIRVSNHQYIYEYFIRSHILTINIWWDSIERGQKTYVFTQKSEFIKFVLEYYQNYSYAVEKISIIELNDWLEKHEPSTQKDTFTTKFKSKLFFHWIIFFGMVLISITALLGLMNLLIECLTNNTITINQIWQIFTEIMTFIASSHMSKCTIEEIIKEE